MREMESFVAQRSTEILNDTSFVRLGAGGKLALHLVPVSAFNLGADYDVVNLNKAELPPLYCLGSEEQINLEGHLVFCTSGRDEYLSYVQMFRNGSIESISHSMLMDMSGDSNEIAGVFIEGQLIETLPK